MPETPSLPVLKVLLLLPYGPAPFMQWDIDALGRHFDLDVLVHNRGKWRLFTGMLRRLLFDRPDVLLMWFIVPSYALPFILLAKLLRVKVGFFTGGYDVVSIPGIGFGAMRFPLFRFLLKPTLALADLTVAMSQSAARQVRKYARPRRMVTLYQAVDTSFFSPQPHIAREALAVTVSPIIESSIVQKGLGAFVEAAQYAPGVKFVLVGRSPDGSIEKLRARAAPNVEFADRFLPAEELRDLYARASCYVQASAHEGFGIAVAEAMSCGAVPVVTRVFSLPEVTGGLGEYVPFGDARAIAAAVRRTLSAPQQLRNALRRQVEGNFTSERRERELVELLLGLAPRRRRLDS